MKDVIITASDEKNGDFLVHHWLRSLNENVDLSNIDVIILDYGLNKGQRDKLRREGITVRRCKRNGHVTIIRYRDIANFLQKKDYSMVLCIDSGDIIFQDGIEGIFEKRTKIRAFPEKYSMVNFNKVFLKGFFRRKDVKRIEAVLSGKHPLNGGVIVGPKHKMLALAKEVFSLVKNKWSYGPDQVAMNYILYRDGFAELDVDYNMVLMYGGLKFRVRRGVFYFTDGRKIPIVHNAGGVSYFRCIKNFGYGPEMNKVKRLTYLIVRKSFAAKKLARKIF